MVLLVNSRGGVISVPKPRAEKLLAGDKFKKAPKGSVKGQYLVEFDELTPKPEEKESMATFKPKVLTPKKSTKKKTKKK